jgi:hypothetical protein
MQPKKYQRVWPCACEISWMILKTHGFRRRTLSCIRLSTCILTRLMILPQFFDIQRTLRLLPYAWDSHQPPTS